MSRASPGSRIAAAVIDAAVGVALTVALAPTLGLFFARRAVVTLRIGEPGTYWQGPVPMVLGAFGEIVYLLPFTLFVARLVEPLTGASLGQRALGLRTRADNGGAATRGGLMRRAVIQTVGLWGCTLALVAGRWEIAVLAVSCGAIVLLGCLGALGPGGLTLHDRLSRTRVDRRP